MTDRRRQVLEEKRALLKYELPHLFGWKWYPWARKFFESTNPMCLLTAANQISKSTTQIRKSIHWATEKSIWKKLWPKSHPQQFWYLYPSAGIATTEFQEKWVPEIMPKRGNFTAEKFQEECDDPIYGWKARYDKKMLYAIDFKSGITLYFKYYSQNVMNLQAGTVHAIFCDEELPETHYDELAFRLEAIDGYFSMVFTATRNQVLWLLAMEAKGSMEKFNHAFKQQISMYDCMLYEDGTPSQWTEEKIERAKAKCKNEAEVKRRVYGRFVQDKGRKYSAFDPTRHFVKPFPLPKGVTLYGGMDYGSGGNDGHPSGLGYIALDKNHRKGWIVEGWRGDNISTTAGDLCTKYWEGRDRWRKKHPFIASTYDPACKDIETISNRQGESLVKPDKSHEVGEELVNSLFKADMLFIFDTPELQKMGTELMTVMKDTPKRIAKDDLIDGGLRYPVTIMPWDYSLIRGEPTEAEKEQSIKEFKKKPLTEAEHAALEIRQRRGEDIYADQDENNDWSDLTQSIEDWNEEYG